ncbi:MAG: thioredoxin domain-containing protein [Bacteroidetes bacterium]|nr:thioredoxin domain-containing protein [Bacteroidota bacterium]
MTKPTHEDGDHAYTNRLIDESSPYLLQHAHNPVDWYPWGDEALNKAKEEDKPLLVSIGYSSCHWCHVMEHESFEDTAIARLMNENFICIKIDREERPDIDHIYMDAVQILTRGSGGWPLNIFLTPNTNPFHGGTYFPPKPSVNRQSWKQTLEAVLKYYRNNREQAEQRGEEVMKAVLEQSTNFIAADIDDFLGITSYFDTKSLDSVYTAMAARFDKRQGGFGRQPKFPNSFNLQYLLNYYYFSNSQPALEHAELSMKKMIMGGIYDQIGGGFCRYSTDAKWLVPHFEKMLYDNANLVMLMSDLYKITRDDIYKEGIVQTLDWVKREMTADEGGFYSAMDADSEGEEGKYYVWEKSEIETILGENSEWFLDYYGVKEGGNWEGHNILNRKIEYAEFAEKNNIDVEELKKSLQESRKKLLKEREKRIPPGLDDKTLLGWNALMVSAYARAYEAIGRPEYLVIAERTAGFLLKEFRVEPKSKTNFQLYHTYKEGVAKINAFLDDYALLANALIDVYEINYDEDLLILADGLIKHTLANFNDEADGLFFFTPVKQNDISTRKKEFYDNVVPSGNSVMARNLQRMGIIMGNAEYSEQSQKMIVKLKRAIIEYPGSFAIWASTMTNYVYPIQEIAVVGKKSSDYAIEITSLFIPNRIIMVTKDKSDFPLLKGKDGIDETLIYICRNYACKLPVNNVNDAIGLINN